MPSLPGKPVMQELQLLFRRLDRLNRRERALLAEISALQESGPGIPLWRPGPVPSPTAKRFVN